MTEELGVYGMLLICVSDDGTVQTFVLHHVHMPAGSWAGLSGYNTNLRTKKLECSLRYNKQEERATYRAAEYNVPPLIGIDQGGPICLLIGPKQTNLVEDVETLLPVKLRRNPFSGFREVENFSTSQKPERPSCFSDRQEKDKLCRGC